MKMLKRISLVIALALFSVATVFAQKLPNIHILATGGTIAGTGSSSTGTNYTARSSCHWHPAFCRS